MSSENPAAQTQAAHHEHEWEVSTAPLAAVAGIFFLVPMGFSSHFVYENTLLAILFVGLGIPLLVFGVSKWVSEGLDYKPLKEGLAGIGLPIFIVSEALIFLSLFATYWLVRLMAPSWPPEGSPDMPVALPLIMTAILVSSSVTIHIGEDRLDQGDLPGFRKWLMITIGLGLLFFACTFYEYNHLLSVGFAPSTNIFSTAFFTITGFHASHVLIGAFIFVAVLVPALRGRINKTFVMCASVYWHFVDIVWFFVVSQIYFW